MATYTAFGMDGLTSEITAQMRAEMTSVDTLVTNAGWVQTSDTGQLNISTAVWTSVSSYVYGSRLYYFNDSQNITFPVILRVIFGNNSGIHFQITCEVGYATDGAGNLMGWKYAFPYAVKDASILQADWWTAGSNSIATWGEGYSFFHKNQGTANDKGVWLGFHREFDDSTGAPKTGGNYTFYVKGPAASYSVVAFSVVRTMGLVYNSSNAANFCMVPHDRTTSWSINNADIYRHYHPYPLIAPSGAFCTYLSPDIQTNTTFSTQLLTGGSARTFLAMPITRASVTGLNSVHRLAVLWE
jgi:hypothetical protein